MPAQVHPSTSELRKPSALRGEAVLGAPELTGSLDDVPNLDNRAEFDIFLDFLDTDSNGKVTALELADFVDSLLATQDHQRAQGSVVFEAVLLTALRHSHDARDASAQKEAEPGPRAGQRPPPPPPLPRGPDAAKSESGKWTVQPQSQPQFSGNMPSSVLATMLAGGPEAHAFAGQRFLAMDSVRNCFIDLLADTDLWVRLAGTYSTMIVSLFRQLLMYSAGGLEKRFSFGTFVKTYAAFNALPLWLPFPGLWRGDGKHGILLAVYLHQLTKLHQQLGPWLSRRLDMHRALLVLTFIQFTATYVPLIAFFAAHGVPAMWRVHSLVDWSQASQLRYEITVFASILPFAALQFLTSSGALKLSCRDFISLKDQCKAVFLLGDVSTQFEGYAGLTVRTVMDRIKARVEIAQRRSGFRKLNAAMPLVFGISLELFRRLVRLFLVRNWVAQEVLGKVVTPFEVYALFYNIWFAYSESADCTAYLFLLKKTSNTFKALLSKEEALSQALPWLNNHSPRNLLLWSRLRRYYQSPNCLELRWIEMHLTLVVVAAIAVTVILIVTFVQKQLLQFTPENADLQLFIIWVIPAFIYLLAALVVDVVMSASTGAEYHDGVMTLSSEAVAIADRLNSAEELGRCDTAASASDLADAAGRQAAATAAGAGGGMGAPARSALRLSDSEAGSITGSSRRRFTDSSGDAALAAGGKADQGWTMWRPAEHYRLAPAEREKLRQCLEVIKSLVSYIQFNAEYITLFGIPIDTHLRNTLFSVSVTLVGAGISAFLAIVVRR